MAHQDVLRKLQVFLIFFNKWIILFEIVWGCNSAEQAESSGGVAETGRPADRKSATSSRSLCRNGRITRTGMERS